MYTHIYIYRYIYYISIYVYCSCILHVYILCIYFIKLNEQLEEAACRVSPRCHSGPPASQVPKTGTAMGKNRTSDEVQNIP